MGIFFSLFGIGYSLEVKLHVEVRYYGIRTNLVDTGSFYLAYSKMQILECNVIKYETHAW